MLIEGVLLHMLSVLTKQAMQIKPVTGVTLIIRKQIPLHLLTTEIFNRTVCSVDTLS